ncbi:insulinase family protein [Parendozoicomonas haliclonae]|uniref:Protease 3 n=1 Tax=Parendozoicomonas haliclonae TaxID=1960125 RepID=A0A1X7AIG5_9GAMM|nr:insulinase family protein [Parendozoicomonas haliclonae]SMA45211.1 Protease 3 precursor [Parendozoicomonas haliclonae]
MHRLPSLLITVILSLFLSSCQALPTIPAHDSVSIIKSPSDPRDYRYLVLENGVRVILTHSPDSETAAASVGVYAGSEQNPDNFPGLAHLLEHMLFLGSEKYPEPNSFDEFLSQHGGFSNAWTADTETIYFFSIQKDALFPALDRLAQFFISPLLAPELIDRERHAVDSEFQIYKQQDGWRQAMVKRATFNPEHPASRFAVGNLDTLPNTPELQQALRRFHNTWYVSQNMAISLVSNHSLDEMEEQVKLMLGGIPKRKAPDKPNKTRHYTAKETGIRIDVQTQTQSDGLHLTFPLESDPNHLTQKSSLYVSHFLGHEGKGSLNSLLLQQGWIQGLYSYAVDTGNEAKLEVYFNMTDKGQQHIDEIIRLTFDYIHLVQQEGVQDSLYQEIRQTQELAFRFMEIDSPDSLATDLVERLEILPPEQLIAASYTFKSYNPKRIQHILAQLTPDNMLVRVSSDQKPPVEEAELKTEPWMGMTYSTRKLSEDQQAFYLSPSPMADQLAIPPTNTFLPEDLTLNDGQESKKPKLIVNKPGMKVWNHFDRSFATPKTHAIIRFQTTYTDPDVDNVMRFRLYSILLNEIYLEPLYMAGMADLSYSLWHDDEGFLVEFSGFNDNLPGFMETVLGWMQTVEFDETRLTQKKELMRKHIQNIDYMDPSPLLRQALKRILVRSEHSPEAQLQAMENITAKDLQAWSQKLFDRAQIRMLISGNASSKQRDRMIATVAPLASSNAPIPKPILPGYVPAQPAENICSVSYINADAAVLVTNTALDKDLKTRATYSLLASVLESPFYAQLRTQEQLGYLVGAFSSETQHYPSMSFIIQAPDNTPEFVGERIQTFLSGFKTTLAELPDEQLNTLKEATTAEILSPEKTMSGQAFKFWNDLDGGFIDFNQTELLAKAIQSINKQDLQKLFETIADGQHTITLYGYHQNKLPEQLPPACNDPGFTDQIKHRKGA